MNDVFLSRRERTDNAKDGHGSSKTWKMYKYKRTLRFSPFRNPSLYFSKRLVALILCAGDKMVVFL